MHTTLGSSFYITTEEVEEALAVAEEMELE